MSKIGDNLFAPIIDALNAGLQYQTNALQAARETTEKVHAENIKYLEDQFGQAQSAISPLLQAAQMGTSVLGDFLGFNGPQKQQQYIQSLAASGQATAQPALNLVNSWNNQNNPVNMVSNLLGLQTTVGGQAGSNGTGQMFQNGTNGAGSLGGYTPTPLRQPNQQASYKIPTEQERAQYNQLLQNPQQLSTPQGIQQLRDMQAKFGSNNLNQHTASDLGFTSQNFPSMTQAQLDQFVNPVRSQQDSAYIAQMQQGGNQNINPQSYVMTPERIAQLSPEQKQVMLQNMQQLQSQYSNNPQMQQVTAQNIQLLGGSPQSGAVTPNSGNQPAGYTDYRQAQGTNIFTDLATSTGTPQAPQFGNIVNDVYNNPTIQAAIQKEIDYGTRNASNQLNAQGMNLSGRQLSALSQLGQGMAQESYGNKLNQALGLAQNNYNTTLASDTSQRLAGLNAMTNTGNSAYNANTDALTSLFGSAYNAGLGSNQAALAGLLQTGLGAAQSTANVATGLGQALVGTNTQYGQDVSNNYLTQGNIAANWANAMGQLQFQKNQMYPPSQDAGFGIFGAGMGGMGLAAIGAFI